MRCHVCGKGPQDGVTLFRQNPKGEKGVWACDDHAEKMPDGETLYVIDALERASQETPE